MADQLIGVLAVQGDFREHISMLHKCHVEAKEVRLPEDLEALHGLIIPGGESTVMGKLLADIRLDDAIIKKYKQGMAIWGCCAGAILLADSIEDSKQPKLGLLSMKIKRNHYGRQINSFEDKIMVKGIGEFPGIFIRAPFIKSIGRKVEVIAEYQGGAVMVQQGKLLATTFHPELTGRTEIHKYFLEHVATRSNI